MSHHACIGFRLMRSGGVYAWDVQADGRDVQLQVSGPVRVTDPVFALDLALAGLGIAYVFEPLAREAIRSGRLQWLLSDTAIEEPGLFAYYPRRASEAPKLRAFVACARDFVVGRDAD
jgi:DNA-binding transcriptional LysR family regulator